MTTRAKVREAARSQATRSGRVPQSAIDEQLKSFDDKDLRLRSVVGYCGTKKRYLHRLRTTHDGLTSLQFEPLKIDLFT